MRRLLALALPLVAAAGVLPAVAAPTAATGRVASVRVELPAAHGARLVVTLRATKAAAGDRLDVSTSTCDPECSVPRYFEGALPKGALTVDAKTAKAGLAAMVGGESVKVTWRPSLGSPQISGGTYGSGTDERTTISTYRDDPAVALVEVAGGGCRGPASVGDSLDVSTAEAGDDGTEPLADLRLPALGAPSCRA